MKPFLDENFLLKNDVAVELYHQYAKDMPIIDYHCHLDPQEIYENKSFANLTEIWLAGDHYKWRLMRANGIDEQYVTGSASDYDKWISYAKTVPMAIGNPLYHWSHLELQRYFGIDTLINEANAPEIWEQANVKLTTPALSVRSLITRSNVEVICTTDDPADSLIYHQKLRDDANFAVQVLPSFRPDRALELNRDGFVAYINKLAEVSGLEILSYSHLLEALANRVAFFHEAGCRLSDHGLNEVPFAETSEKDAAAIFAKAIVGEKVSQEEENKYKTHLLVQLGRLYTERGWTMQLHLNALRNSNSAMLAQIGPDTGFDSINDGPMAGPLSGLLDALAREQVLPQTILYSLNARDFDVMATLMGSFQDGRIPGKMQLGSAWWFNDTLDGMELQMKTLANMGLFGRFVGMLTDSRSFLSFTRHEYFRRLLCNIIGTWVEDGELPYDQNLLKTTIEGICYNNAKAYFRFDGK